MKLVKNRLAFLSLVLPFMLFGQVESIFNDIRLNESLQVVTQKLSKIADSLNVISVDKTSFPLAHSKKTI